MSTILITGSSTGIGYATAETLARSGHRVYATMRNPKRSPQLQQMADKENLPLTILPMDVLHNDSVQEAVKFVLSKEGHIDVLVNNAGIGSWGAVEELPMELFKADMDTNYFGTVRCVKAVLPSMRQRKEGCIINVTSIAGKLYFNFHATYCSSKAAVEAFSEALAQEVKPFNIRIAMVEPGIIETPIFKKANDISATTCYPNSKRFLSIFAASLENHVSPFVVADVIKDVVSGKRNTLRNTAGPDAEGLLGMRNSMTDEDWVNSVNVDDETWINNTEQMGLAVEKYMRAEGFPKFDEKATLAVG